MLKNRTFHVKMVKDPVEPESIEPEVDLQEVATEIIQEVVVAVIFGYTICKSVDFVFRMAEHAIVSR